MQHTVSETGGEQERRRLRSAAVTSAQNRPRLCILATAPSSASYRHSMRRKPKGKEKRIKQGRKRQEGRGQKEKYFPSNFSL